MGVALILVFLNIFIFIFAVVTLAEIWPHRHLRSTPWLFLLNICFCIISFCTLLVYVGNELAIKAQFFHLRFLGLGLIGPTWLLFISSVFNRWQWLQKKTILPILFLPGIITVLFSVIPSWNYLLIDELKTISILGLHVLTVKQGPWFIVHYIWTFLTVLSSIYLCVDVSIKNRGALRRQAIALVSGTILSVCIDVYAVTINPHLRWLMISSGTFILNQAGTFYAVITHNLFNVTSLAMKKMFQDFPDPVLVIDESDILRSGNKAAKKYFSFTEKHLGARVETLFPQMNMKPGEIEYFSSDGHKYYFELNIEPLDAGPKRSRGKILFFRQVTFHKALEYRLNENMQFKAHLLALVAHDLAGHMEGQSLLTQSLAHVEAKELKDRLYLLLDSALASKSLLANIMSWVKTQGSELSPQYRDFEWNSLIRDCMEQMAPQWEFKDIKIQFQSEKFPLLAIGDSEMLMAVVRNIISNAIKATTPGNEVSIVLSQRGHNAFLVIKDSGMGVTLEQLQQIRESSFSFSGHSIKSATGFGIGLAMARHFIQLHDGQFSMDSKIGEGTSVEVQIPLKPIF